MRSGFEKIIRQQLKDAGVKFKYESEKFKYTYEGTYNPDFVLDLGKKKIYIEAKGFLKPSERRKILAVKESNPKIDLRLVFQTNGFVYKNKKGAPRRTPESTDMRYGDWADKYGIKWAVGEVPKEWLKTKKKK
jgi:predicted nuclease of restriction endonuclease-like RecB superfamily